MKKLVLTLCLLFSTAVSANPIDDKCSHFATWGAPQIKTEGNNQYICKTGYAVNLNYKTKVAYFVVEHITADHLKKSVGRKDDFREDAEVPAEYRVTLKDYVGSNLDRGHMAPAADFVYDSKVMSESFFLDNMMPQSQPLNRGAWKLLEEKTRDLVAHGDVYAITGTIYEGEYKTIGNKVGVPTHIYKVIIQPSKERMVAFLFPNEKVDPKQLAKYIVSVADLETKAGVDFSPAIPENLKALEATAAKYEDWF